MKKFHVGCSGFQYKNWLGPFYPPKVNLLPFYANHLKSVEINSSFYSLPTEKSCGNWRKNTPEDFTFVLKGNRVITHRRRINGSETQTDYLEKFAAAADQLGEKLVGVLWQFPPNFHATQVNVDRLSRFQDSVHNRLPGNSFEFRHPSWLNVWIMDDIWDRGNAFVRHDHAHLYCMDVPKSPFERISYTRFHGPNGDCRGRYAPYYLQDQAVVAHERDVPHLMFFNNDIDVGAPFDAQEIQQCLDSLSSGRGPDVTPIRRGHSSHTPRPEPQRV